MVYVGTQDYKVEAHNNNATSTKSSIVLIISSTLFGALIMGVINNGLDLMGVSSYYQQVIKGTIIIGAILLDSLRKEKE